MNILNNKPLRDRLSAAYVLGTLKGPARRRFETILRSSARLEQDVLEWQRRLNPLAEFAGTQQPPERVWNAITQRLNLATRESAATQHFWRKLSDNLNFWRTLGLVSSTLTAVLLITLLVRQPESVNQIASEAAPASTSFVAMLTDEHAQPNLMVVGDPAHHRLTAKILTNPAMTTDQALQLWAIPKHGNPRSLGLLARNGSITLPLPANATPQDIVALAVSLEPLHGSPNPDGPSGPVLFKGAWQQI